MAVTATRICPVVDSNSLTPQRAKEMKIYRELCHVRLQRLLLDTLLQTSCARSTSGRYKVLHGAKLYSLALMSTGPSSALRVTPPTKTLMGKASELGELPTKQSDVYFTPALVINSQAMLSLS